jgi:hypothetical protein
MSQKRYTDARFCPMCGVESLVRDDFRKDHGKTMKDGRTSYHNKPAEFICTTCHCGFGLHQSLRSERAAELFAEHRKKRGPDDRHEERTAAPEAQEVIRRVR